jgi:hypothetical protein
MKGHIRNLVLVLTVVIAAACGSHSRDESQGETIHSVSSALTSQTALFVVGNTTLGAGDAAVQARLVALGFTVTVVKDSTAQTSDATGKQLVVISSTVTSANVGPKFTTVAVPVLDWESALLDDLKMTSTSNTDFGIQGNQTTVQIGGPANDFMTAGLTGSVAVTSAAATFSWGKPPGKPNANATVLATLGDATRSVIFRYDTNDQMFGQTAPERRVAFFLEDATASLLTAAGTSLLDAAIRWASHKDQSLGASCTANNDCASNFCADGMCCNTACNTACSVCSAGTCGPSGYGDTDNGTCAGGCDGSGACSPFPTKGLQVMFLADAAQVDQVNGIASGWSDETPNKFDLSGNAIFAPTVPAVVFNQSHQMTAPLAKIGSFNAGMTLVMTVAAPHAAGAGVFVDMSEFVHASVFDAKSAGALSVSYSSTSDQNPPPPPAPQPGEKVWSRVVSSGSGNWQTIQITQNGDGSVPGAQNIEASNQPTDVMIHVNGTPGQVATGIEVPFSGNKTIQVGSIGSTNPTEVRAIFVYNRVLTSTERVQLQTYINSHFPPGAGAPSCFDGIKNQDETGMDCGGATCPACTNSILFVVGDTNLGPGDLAVQQAINAYGYNVQVVKDSNALTTDANGKALVMISSTVTSSIVGSKFAKVAVPVLVWESALFDDMGMTTAASTDLGTQANQTELVLAVSTDDFMAHGVSSTTPIVTSSPQKFSWGVPGAEAKVVARLGSDITKSAIFRYEKGSHLVGPLDKQLAAERRVGLFLEDTTATALTQDGVALVTNAALWAARLDLTATGLNCDDDSSCISGHCVDGLCCNTACADLCMQCGINRGICEPTPVNLPDTSPNGSCASCGDFGSCPTFPASDLLARFEADPSFMVLQGGTDLVHWYDMSGSQRDLDGFAQFAPEVPAAVFNHSYSMTAATPQLGSFPNGLTIVMLVSAPEGGQRTGFFVDMSEFVHASISDPDGSNLLTASYSTSGTTTAGIFDWSQAVGTGVTNWQVVQFTQTAQGTAEVNVNGESNGTTDAVPVPDPHTKQFQIGSAGSDTPLLVRAVYMYGHVLTTAESDQLRDYLLNRWSLDAGGPGCFDGIKQANEAGTDCEGVCNFTCPTCTDQKQNQGEKGIDCGGPCKVCSHCDDKVWEQNLGEDDVDCGGECKKCCGDGQQDFDETGPDCGGLHCAACVTCDAAHCGQGSCPPCPPCKNGVQDPGETGVDCGGPSCPACFTDVTDALISCASTCHSDVAKQGGFSMASYSNFVAQSVDTLTRPAQNPPDPTHPALGPCANQFRVKAGDPANSLLYQKLKGIATCGRFEMMPPSPSGVPDATIQIVKSWILGGAANSKRLTPP